MDEDWDWDPDQIADLDVTGDPQLDQFGYQSPRDRGNRTGFNPGPHVDWLAQAKADQRQRGAKRRQQAQQRKEMRRRNAPPPEQPPPAPTVAPMVAWPPHMAYQPGIGLQQPGPVTPKGPQPGQHGAYFEVRTKRVWYAPWRKRKVWQQISTWHVGQPPAGATVVTVADVAALPGRVHTIGRISDTGAVEY